MGHETNTTDSQHSRPARIAPLLAAVTETATWNSEPSLALKPQTPRVAGTLLGCALVLANVPQIHKRCYACVHRLWRPPDHRREGAAEQWFSWQKALNLSSTKRIVCDRWQYRAARSDPLIATLAQRSIGPNVTAALFDWNQNRDCQGWYEKATSAEEQRNIRRLPYDKQYELAYKIYEALCAHHADWLVALTCQWLGVSRGLQRRVRVRSAVAAFIAICEVGGDPKSWFLPPGGPLFTRLRACGSLQRNALHIVIGLVTLTREA